MATSLKEKAYNTIKSRILDMTYLPDSFLDEKALIDELGISRTPVREAMITLSQEGYLEIIPKRGIRVIPLSFSDIVSIFEIRKMVEPWLAVHSGPLCSKDELEREKELIRKEVAYNKEHHIRMPGISVAHHPHSLLVSKCTNRFIKDLMLHMEEQGNRKPQLVSSFIADPEIEDEEKYYNDILTAHLEIVEAIENKEYEKAADCLIEHVETAQDLYNKFWFRSGF